MTDCGHFCELSVRSQTTIIYHKIINVPSSWGAFKTNEMAVYCMRGWGLSWHLSLIMTTTSATQTDITRVSYNECDCCTYITDLWHRISRLIILSNCIGTCTSEHDQIQQRVGTEPISAVHRDARRLAGTIQTSHYFVLSIHMLYHLRPKTSQCDSCSITHSSGWPQSRTKNTRIFQAFPES